MIDLLLVFLAGALAFIFGWNNSSLLIGNIRASGSYGVRAAVAMSVAGLLAGVLLGGPRMLKSFDGTLVPSCPAYVLEVTFVVTIALTVGLTLIKLPATFSGIMVGAFLGGSEAFHLAVNVTQVILIVSFWFIAPVVAGLIALVLRRTTSSLVGGLSIVGVDSFNRLAILVTSLGVAFVLGANNVGLIAGTALGGGAAEGTEVAAGLAILAGLGAALLGRDRVSDTVGDKMLSLSPQGVFAVFAGAAIATMIGTQLQVPISIGQSVLGGMIGAAYSQRTAVINRRVAAVTFGTWLVTPVVALLLGYLVASI